MTLSDWPASFPGKRYTYESAVSMKLPPAAAQASSTANDCSWSAVQPNTFPPEHSGAAESSAPPGIR